MSESSFQKRFHPLTGEQLIPLTFTGKNGIVKFVWPVLGGSQPAGEPGDGTTGDGTGNGTGSTGGGTDGDGTGDGSTGDSGTGGGSTGGSAETDPDKLRVMLQAANADAAAKRHAAKALQLANEQMAAKLKAVEDKDKTELERAQGDLKTATEQAEALQNTVKELRIQNAFLASNTHAWQNPDVARKLADLSEVVIDDDGKVTGLDKALAKLAKDHPYLLKPSAGAGGATGGSSGAPAGSTGQGHNAKHDRATTAARFPAAVRRR